ncbi:MAG: extracellular solute-binding protein [Pelagimonas sp.]|uniref:ABC transporter substrate-binding protein n=1 Tax=Pelagimonas sp. TaxID=2073170 RepID=UPI003D6C45BA
MRIIGFLGAMLLAGAVQAFEIEDQRTYPAETEETVLRIISTADMAVFEPVLKAFQAEHPGTTIAYTVTGTSDLMTAIYEEGAEFDVAISSAMDLQTKLANDGFAVPYKPAAIDLPEWATWRDQLFAFTQEPAVLVVSDAFFGAGEAPRNRDELIAILRNSPERFDGKIGTYDVRRSGFGYLMATQDSRNSEAFWRLMEVMGRLNARLYCCSSDMIRDVAEGRLALAYNVLGSYAAAQAVDTPGFHIIEMSDFTNVMSRTALIPATVENETGAQAMIEFLLSYNQRPDLITATGLPAINSASFQSNTALRPIRFGPGLLVFLDQLKRESFLRNWESSLEQK